MFKFSKSKLALVAGLALSSQFASAAVLTFDDLNGYLPPGPPTIQEEWFTSTYNGFKFGDLSPTTNSWFYSQRAVPGVYRAASGNTFAATDLNQYSGNPLEGLLPGQTITSATDFYFNGAYFSGFDQIQYKLYNNGVLVHTSAVFDLVLDTPIFFANTYTGVIDEIEILGTQGYYAMDDFTYNAPEPGSMAMVLLAGVAGVAATRRKKA